MAPLTAEPLPTGDELRQQVVSGIGSLLGDGKVLLSRLPLPGSPILAQDGQGLPVVVSFESGDGHRAIFDGVAALESVATRREWLIGLCPTIPEAARFESLRLVVLTPEMPTGWPRLALASDRLTFFTMQAIGVDGTVRILFTPWHGHTQAKGLDGGSSLRLAPFRAQEVELNAEEAAFFAVP